MYNTQIEAIKNALLEMAEEPCMIDGLDLWADVIAEKLYEAGCRIQIIPEYSDSTANQVFDKRPNNESTFCLCCPNHPNNGGSGFCNCILGTPIIT